MGLETMLKRCFQPCFCFCLSPSLSLPPSFLASSWAPWMGPGPASSLVQGCQATHCCHYPLSSSCWGWCGAAAQKGRLCLVWDHLPLLAPPLLRTPLLLWLAGGWWVLPFVIKVDVDKMIKRCLSLITWAGTVNTHRRKGWEDWVYSAWGKFLGEILLHSTSACWESAEKKESVSFPRCTNQELMSKSWNMRGFGNMLGKVFYHQSSWILEKVAQRL